MYILNWFTCQKNGSKPSHLHVRFLNGNWGIKFDYKLNHNWLKRYPKVLVKTVLINFTRTDHKLESTLLSTLVLLKPYKLFDKLFMIYVLLCFIYLKMLYILWSMHFLDRFLIYNHSISSFIYKTCRGDKNILGFLEAWACCLPHDFETFHQN